MRGVLSLRVIMCRCGTITRRGRYDTRVGGGDAWDFVELWLGSGSKCTQRAGFLETKRLRQRGISYREDDLRFVLSFRRFSAAS